VIVWLGAKNPLGNQGVFCLRAHFPLGSLLCTSAGLTAGEEPGLTMSHQFSSGVFCYNKPAWHRLGVVVDGTLSAREAFRIANADFQVAGRPVFDADMQPIAGYQAITRMDTGRTLSVMTETYTPIQNDSLIRIAEALHENISMDAVCVLSEGKKVTFTARIRGAEGDVVPGDPVQQYLVGCTSHDGSIPFQLMFSPVRVVCHNTLSAALGMASSQRHRDISIRIRHTKNADSLLARLPELVDMRRRQFIGGLDELRHMAVTPCSMTQFRQYITTVFADQLQGTVNDVRGDKSTARPRVLEDLPGWSSVLRKFEGEAIGSNLIASSGTAWGAYQAVTEFMTHESGKSKDPIEAARKRLESTYWGRAHEIINLAHSAALAIR
jgi:phage/plasmid-like protein (TIGR03299 family)